MEVKNEIAVPAEAMEMLKKKVTLQNMTWNKTGFTQNVQKMDCFELTYKELDQRYLLFLALT